MKWTFCVKIGLTVSLIKSETNRQIRALIKLPRLKFVKYEANTLTKYSNYVILGLFAMKLSLLS